jgi:L-cysteine desulfidase
MEMNQELYQKYVEILKSELVPALGCTEPIALAYAAAVARKELGQFPEKVEVLCSGNIIKNVKGVKVPNSGGMKGVEAAVILGIVGGKADRELEVLQSISEEDREKTRQLFKEGYCECKLKEGTANLYIEVRVWASGEEAAVRIEHAHTNITRIEHNQKVVYENEEKFTAHELDKSCLNIKDITAFANEVKIADVKDVLMRQIEYNYAISEEGLQNTWGAQIGKIIREEEGDQLKWKMISRAAAGSDARMSGCSLPVKSRNDLFSSGYRVCKRKGEDRRRTFESIVRFQLDCSGSKEVYWCSFGLLWSGMCSGRSRRGNHIFMWGR